MNWRTHTPLFVAGLGAWVSNFCICFLLILVAMVACAAAGHWKIAGTIEDIRAWPIRGIVVFAGEGFSPNMRAYLVSTGVAVELEDMQKWLELYFGL